MRSWIKFSVSLGMVLTMLLPIHAEFLRGDARAGHVLAKAWCTGCHRVDSETFGMFAADFAEVAKLPSTTALSLKVFLQTSHKNMPDFTLTRGEADDVIAYILSLKRK